MVTNNYNESATADSPAGDSLSAVNDPKEVGGNVELEVAGAGSRVPVSNVSFSEEADTSEVQYTSGFHKSIAVTGVTYSGSFEIPGNANAVREAGWEQGQEDRGVTSLPKEVSSITLTDGVGKTYTFVNVLLNSHSKDVPSDDRTTMSFDFMAERLKVSGGE